MGRDLWSHFINVAWSRYKTSPCSPIHWPLNKIKTSLLTLWSLIKNKKVGGKTSPVDNTHHLTRVCRRCRRLYRRGFAQTWHCFSSTIFCTCGFQQHFYYSLHLSGLYHCSPALVCPEKCKQTAFNYIADLPRRSNVRQALRCGFGGLMQDISVCLLVF